MTARTALVLGYSVRAAIGNPPLAGRLAGIRCVDPELRERADTALQGLPLGPAR